MLCAQESVILRCDFEPSPIAHFDEEMAAIRAKNGILLPQLADGENVALRFPRSEARAQDRWLVGKIEIRPELGKPSQMKLELALFGIGETEPAASLKVVPKRAKGRIEVDLRTAKLDRARVVVRLMLDGQRVGAAETFVSARPTQQLPVGTKIPIQLEAPDGVDAKQSRPLSFGVPIAPGALWETGRLRLVNGAGNVLPSQAEIVALWAREGSIQWVRFNTIAAPAGEVFVEVAESTAEAKSELRIEESGQQLLVDTGAARYTLERGTSPVAEIQMGGRRVASSAETRGLYVVDQNGRMASAAVEGETMEVESRGPVSACVRFEGDYRTADGRRLARHITRLEFYARQAEAKIQHTLVLTEDSNEVWFTDIGWELAVDAGGDAETSFAISRDDASKFVSVQLTDADDSAWLLQDSHFRFQHGTNHFAVNGPAGVLREGEECGDWFALHGEHGGLGWSCRDAAWQHPKEFETRPDRMTLHLWSSRGGEKLDFKMASFTERWDLAGWLEKVAPRRDLARIPKLVAQAEKIEHNAIGWAKTHELLLRPLAPRAKPETMAVASRAHSRPVLALADPNWLYESQAMGPLHPRDPEEFPGVEAAIDGAAVWWHGRIHAWGEYGFVDYYGGPHLSYRGDYALPKRYHWATYGLRPGLWMLYARSGDRNILELASKNNQSFMDNTFAHWDGPGKTRGLYLGSNIGGDDLSTPATLPLYWQARTSGNISSSTDLNQFLRDYYLTGNRRARDVVKQYAQAAKQRWSPKVMQSSWRALMDYRCLAQCYTLDWDPELRAMAEATLEIFSDDESEVGLTKERPYRSSTYKTQADFGALADGWEILGTPRSRDIVFKIARYQAPVQFGASPLGYNSPAGRLGHILHAETSNPAYAEAMALQLRWLAASWDPEKNAFRGDINAAGMLFLTQGAPYAQDVVRRVGAWDKPAASWAGAESFGGSVSFVVRKPDQSALTLWLRRPRGGDPGDAGSRVSVRALDAPSAWGLDLNRVDSDSNRNSRIELPKDAPEAAYEIKASGSDQQLLRADARAPLVLHAPGYWQPAPPQDPAMSWFFRVPEDAEGAAIFCEGATRLFDPSGKPYPDANPQRGWISLPADRAGLWSFEQTERGLVRVRNLPPFFALRDLDFYFEPPIEWERETATDFTRPDPAEVYVPGALTSDGNQALQVTPKRKLVIEGSDALPFKEGTIEFWFRPNFHTLELTAGGGLISLDTAEREPWTLSVKHGAGDQWYLSRTLLGVFATDGASKRRKTRCYRQTLFESGRWHHVAWTWKARKDLTVRGGGSVLKAAMNGVLTQRIYIDGQAGKVMAEDIAGNLPLFAPTRFRTSSAFDGAIDELRISNVMRYREDFEPPARKRAFAADENTLALFHFEGDLNCEGRGKATAELD